MRPELGRYVYNRLYALLRGNIRQHMALFREMECWSRYELRQYQVRQVKLLIDHAYANVPFYRQRFQAQGLEPGDIRSLEDFAMIAPIERDNIRASGAQMLAADKNCSVFARKTSGSSGAPITVYKNGSDLAIMDAMMWHLYGWHGLSMGQPQARVWGTGYRKHASLAMRLKDWALNRRRLSALEITLENCSAYFRVLQKFRPTYMYCYPNAASKFAEIAVALGCDLRSLFLRVIVVTGEMLHPGARKRLADTFGAKVVNEYGTTECGILAFECEAGSLHVPVGTVLLENVAAGGQRGRGKRIIVTDLCSRAMPLIRYEIGDLGDIVEEECACRRPLPVLRQLSGREGSMVIRSDGGFVSDSVFESIFSLGIQQFRVVQKSVSEFDVYAMKGSDHSQALENEHLSRMRKCFGPGISVRITYVSTLKPDPSGKLRSFVSLINDD